MAGNPPCPGSGGGARWRDAISQAQKGSQQGSLFGLHGLSVDLGMHLQGTSLLVSGPRLVNPKFRAVL